MADNKIDLKSVSHLSGKKFVVPNYQRGYKWRKTDVEHLINDIAEIHEDDKSDYCLQPIVVARTEEPMCPHCGQKIQTGTNYILVDGQQRLTTIWLIINWAKHNGFHIEWNYSISYDTRNDSNNFLKDIDEKGIPSINANTCDTHYFLQAIKTIEDHKGVIEKFLKNLEKNVKVIWYEIDPNEGPANFERLNNAKIGLTNAELVKAYILTNSSPDIRARMACEWDEMEYKLQDDIFFSFITTKDSPYSKDYNRIELLLDLYAETNKDDKEKDEYHTFNHIVSYQRNVSVIWHEVQNIFNRLQCWYNDIFLYNLIGFLVETKGENELSTIWKESRGKSINEIKDIVRADVIKTIPSESDIREMEYKDGRTKNVLLLFNILSYMSVTPNPKPDEYKYQFNDKFHFNLYKKEDWDKEHVHATASQALQSKVEWINWLKDLDEGDVSDRLEGEHKTECLEWIKKAKKIETIEQYERIKEDKDEDFKQLSKEVFNKIFGFVVTDLEGQSEDVDLKQNSIGNIVLLSANINRSGEYKVAPFSTKRRIIMDRVKKGQFVPIGTQNVFMKVFTPKPGHFYKWEKDNAYNGNEKSDRESYIDAIIETINRIK